MKNNILFSLIIASFLIGCGKTSEEQINLTKKSASSPEFIVDTPKGKMYRILIYGPYRNDRVYFFDTNSAVTINIDVPQGKTTVVESIVIVDGVEYVRKSQK